MVTFCQTSPFAVWKYFLPAGPGASISAHLMQQDGSAKLMATRMWRFQENQEVSAARQWVKKDCDDNAINEEKQKKSPNYFQS